MSHFSIVKTEIKDRDALVLALNEMKLAYEEDANHRLEMVTRWTGNDKHYASLIVRGRTLDCGADVGFVFDAENKSYKIIADDWELERSKISNFRQKLIEEYTVQIVQKSGYRVTSRSVAADGRMQIEIEPLATVQVRR